MEKLKIGLIGLGQRGAAYGMTDGSIGLLGNILNNSDVLVTALCDGYEERIKFAAEKVMAAGQKKPLETRIITRFYRARLTRLSSARAGLRTWKSRSPRWKRESPLP